MCRMSFPRKDACTLPILPPPFQPQRHHQQTTTPTHTQQPRKHGEKEKPLPLCALHGCKTHACLHERAIVCVCVCVCVFKFNTTINQSTLETEQTREKRPLSLRFGCWMSSIHPFFISVSRTDSSHHGKVPPDVVLLCAGAQLRVSAMSVRPWRGPQRCRSSAVCVGDCFGSLPSRWMICGLPVSPCEGWYHGTSICDGSLPSCRPF